MRNKPQKLVLAIVCALFLAAVLGPAAWALSDELPPAADEILKEQAEKVGADLAEKAREQAEAYYGKAKADAGEHARQAFDFTKDSPVLLAAAALLAGLLVLKMIGLVFRIFLAVAVVAGVIWYLS